MWSNLRQPLFSQRSPFSEQKYHTKCDDSVQEQTAWAGFEPGNYCGTADRAVGFQQQNDQCPIL